MTHWPEFGTYAKRGLSLRFGRPSSRFVIFSRARSGSTLLVDLMNASERVFCDGELFNERPLFPYLYLHSREALCGNLTYGFKLLSYQMFDILPERYRHTFLPNLADEGYKVIYLYRENTLAQEISNLVAHQRGRFHHRRGDRQKPPDRVRVDVPRLLAWLDGNHRYSVYEKEILLGIEHISVSYESDLLEEQRHQSTLDRLMMFLDLPLCPAQTRLRKISQKRLSDFIENYEEVKQALSNTRYAEFIG